MSYRGVGQVTIASEPVRQIDRDAAIAALATPTTAAAPTTSAYLTSGSKSTSSTSAVTPQKDITASFAQSTLPGWGQASEVPIYQSSRAPLYLAIGGAIVLFGIIIIASRRPAKAATANTRRRKRARRRRS